MVVRVSARGEEDDRDAVARVLVVIAPAIDVRWMAVGVHGIIECQRMLLGAIHGLGEIAQLRGESTRSNQLNVVGIAVVSLAFPGYSRVVSGRATTHHVHVELRDDRIARDSRMIGVPLRSVETGFFTDVPYEQQRPLGLDLLRCEVL